MKCILSPGGLSPDRGTPPDKDTTVGLSLVHAGQPTALGAKSPSLETPERNIEHHFYIRWA